MAEELKQAFGVDVTLVPGSGGVFDIIADGKLVYSKSETGRFPNPGEVVKIMKE